MESNKIWNSLKINIGLSWMMIPQLHIHKFRRLCRLLLVEVIQAVPVSVTAVSVSTVAMSVPVSVSSVVVAVSAVVVDVVGVFVVRLDRVAAPVGCIAGQPTEHYRLLLVSGVTSTVKVSGLDADVGAVGAESTELMANGLPGDAADIIVVVTLADVLVNVVGCITVVYVHAGAPF